MIKKGTRLGKAWENCASQSAKTHVLQRIVLYFKEIIVNTENYNQQIHSLHLNYNQQSFSKPFSTLQKVTISQPQSRQKLQRKEKEKEKRYKKEKIGEEKHNGGGGT